MKILKFLFIFLLSAFSALAQTNVVIINWTDNLGSPLAYQQIAIAANTDKNNPFQNAIGGFGAVSKITANLDASGNAYVKNLLLGQYICTVQYPIGTFTSIGFTVTNSNGTNFVNRIASIPIGSPGAVNALTMQASFLNFPSVPGANITFTTNNGIVTVSSTGSSSGNFQTGSASLTNLSNGNGGGLTNLNIAQTNIIYVSKSGSDSLGSRGALGLPFKTITGALGVAVPGDLVYVEPGVYSESNLLRVGVNYFMPGVTISNNPSASDLNGWGIFDDRTCGPTTNIILGKPTLWFSTGTNQNAQSIGTGGIDVTATYEFWHFGATNNMGCIVLTNAGSRLECDLNDIIFTDLSAGSPAVCAAINIINCSYCSINVNRVMNGSANLPGIVYAQFGNTQPAYYPTAIVGSQYGLLIGIVDTSDGISWGAGETHINCTYLDNFGTYTLWPNQSGALTSEQNFYYNGDVVNGKLYQECLTSTATNFVCWYNVKKFVTQTNFSTVSGAINISGGKAYISGFDKIIDQVGNVAVASGTSTTFNSLWLDGEKITTQHGGEWINWGGNGISTCIARVQHYEDTDSTRLSPGGIINNGGNLYVQGGFMQATNGIGILHQSGNTYLQSGLFVDTSAGTGTNAWPVETTGAGLVIQGGSYVSPASTFSIFSPTAQSVSIQGGVYIPGGYSSQVTLSGSAQVNNFTASGTTTLSALTVTNPINGNLNGAATSATNLTGTLAGSQITAGTVSSNALDMVTKAQLFAGGSSGITNTQTGVTLSGTFSGNGSGLTSLPAAQLTGPSASILFWLLMGYDGTPTVTAGANIGTGGTAVLYTLPSSSTNAYTNYNCSFMINISTGGSMTAGQMAKWTYSTPRTNAFGGLMAWKVDWSPAGNPNSSLNYTSYTTNVTAYGGELWCRTGALNSFTNQFFSIHCYP